MRSIGLAAVTLQGFIDAVERGVVYGWAWNPQRPDDRIEVEVLHGDKPLASVTADQFRADLVDLEIGDGHHAFEFNLPEPLAAEADSAEIEVRFAGSVVPLPRVQVRPEPRSRADGPVRAEAELIDSLRDRIAMQEQVIADMSNLLKGMVERVRDLPAEDGQLIRDDEANGLVAQSRRQTVILEGLEVYMATFGQSLRDLSDRLPQSNVTGAVGRGRFRLMDAVFLLLMAGAVIGFAVAFGDIL